MDFESILHAARKNQLIKKEPVNCLQTKFKPPTKQQKEKDRALSDGVARFLARKEEEERRKRKEDGRKRDELAALRAKDPKANKRIQTMLKRTKSASKSVMEDVDSSNTADTIAGPSQPDEDDYGFVSETSNALYNKLIQKMYSTPSNDLPKFAPSKKPTSGNLSNTKERVKMALLKQEEEERLPHKRKRRKKENSGVGDDDEGLDFRAPDRNVDDYVSSNSKDSKDQGKQDKPKPKRPPAPPPMDFMELLKLAEKKQHEPVVIEPKINKSESDQLMTKKQREDYYKLEEWRRQREARLKALERGETPPEVTVDKPTFKRIPKIGQNSAEKRIPKLDQSVETKNERIPKPGSDNDTTKEILSNGHNKPASGDRVRTLPKPKPSLVPSNGPSKKSVESETEKLKRERDEALRVLKEKEAAFKLLEEKERLIRERDEALAKLKQLEEREAKAKATKVGSGSKPVNKNNNKVTETKKTFSKDNRPPDPPKGVREFPPKDVQKSDPPRGVREFPPKDVRRLEPPRSGRGYPTNGVKGPANGSGRPMTKEEIVRKRLAAIKRKQIRDESEDEYDSELDDFIDDGPDPSLAREDVSAVISQIFKYDKNKYSKYDDEGDECMESNWAQISKEEYLSTKCGIMEDLEDMKAEKEALARKKKKKR